MRIKIGLFLMLALLMLLMGWCWWTMQIENFDEKEQTKITEIDASMNLIQSDMIEMQDQINNVTLLSLFNTTNGTFPLMSYYKLDEKGEIIYKDGIPILEFPKGDTGARGMRGIQGIQGVTGAIGKQGEKGDRGDYGRDGASIFDFSRYLLNGDTDLKTKNKYDPQPVGAYTTLFG